MEKYAGFATVIALGMLSGCASIDFASSEDSALKYYEGAPFLQVNTNADCSKATQVLMIPLTEKRLKIKSGVFGSSSMTVKLSNGMVTEVGQTTDTKLPEVSKSFGDVLEMAMMSSNGEGTAKSCQPFVGYFRIQEDGALTPAFTNLK